MTRSTAFAFPSAVPGGKPLRGLRLLTLGLNLPAPVAAQRARQMGARVRKLEPPQGDPVSAWSPALYAQLHAGVAVTSVDLRTAAGQQRLQAELARADVLLTAFRPSAMARLGLTPAGLRRAHPQLDWIQVVGSATAPDEAGHDLTYQAAQGLVHERLPPTLWADMAGAQAVVEALLTLQLQRLQGARRRVVTVGLEDALAAMTGPRQWGLTGPGNLLGGGHAGYAVLPCADAHVAVAALEPKFAAALAEQAGLPAPVDWGAATTQRRLAGWLRGQTADQLRALAATHDLPLVVCPRG